MRDPTQWALTLFRIGGVPVRLHLVFFVFAVGLAARQLQPPHGAERAASILLFTFPLLFLVVLIHEIGRLIAARSVDGDCRELVLWPLGGLVAADVPRDWRSHTFAALGGPAANLLLCLAGSVILLAGGYVPDLNPTSDPYVATMSSYRDGRVYTSEYATRLYEPGTATPAKISEPLINDPIRAHEGFPTNVSADVIPDRALASRGFVWVQRTVWLSFLLVLFNLLPAWPLAMGGVVQGLVWWRSDYAQSVSVTGYAGYVVGAVLFIASIASNEVSVLMLALIVGLFAWSRLNAHDVDESGYGDFSSGYSSLNDADEAPVIKPRRQPFLKRFLTARKAKRIHREDELRQKEDDRMELLLEKISRTGKLSLTDEERRFLERVSARYRNRN